MSLGGRLSGVKKRAREKIRTCTGAPDFEVNKMGGKGEEKHERYRKNVRQRNKSTKEKSKNNRETTGWQRAKLRYNTKTRGGYRLDLTCKDESIHVHIHA